MGHVSGINLNIVYGKHHRNIVSVSQQKELVMASSESWTVGSTSPRMVFYMYALHITNLTLIEML